MQLVTVESSMLHAVGYDDETEELEAIFSSGRIYRYEGVPKSLYEELLAAESKGQFMRSMILGAFPDYELRRSRRR